MAVHPVLHGIINRPFPAAPQVELIEILGGVARIARAPSGLQGNVLHKEASWVHEPYDLAFWFDRPYASVSFQIRCPADAWWFDIYTFSEKDGEHTGYMDDRISDGRVHVLTLNSDSLVGSPGSFRGFTISVRTHDNHDVEFDIDSMTAI